VGYNLTKRISDLREQAEDKKSGQWGFLRTFLFSILILVAAIFFVLPSANYSSYTETEDEVQTDTWHVDLEQQFVERLNWLEKSPIVLFPGTSDMYDSLGQAIVSAVQTKRIPVEGENMFDFRETTIWLARAFTSSLLRISFVILAFWPLWLLASIAGYYFMRSKFLSKTPKSFLGICDPGKGPFYSGIYGPLRPNNSQSGSDFSCPSLACPAMVKENQAKIHRLTALLKKHQAYNETNFELVRIILAHADFPAAVGDENTAEDASNDSPDASIIPLPGEKVSDTGFLDADGFTIEISSLEGLPAVLETHRKIVHYVESLEKKGIKPSALNKNYPGHLGNLKKLSASCDELSKILLACLTPNRLWALAHTPTVLVATAYLATEAGKCLVFKRHGERFSRISHYPHLQARAILQSILSYHSEYKGDARLTARQAIVSSRRHGDFGRAFLPNRMPIESRAIRDWLEILYTDREKREEISHLVELDGHMEELSINWRVGFATKIRKERKDNNDIKWSLWKGIVHKSVVLVPVRDVLRTVLHGIHEERLNRITNLLQLTRAHQTSISTSARLPGFKRQAMEAERSSEITDEIVVEILAQPDGPALMEKWRIVRRMLTRYNWLSTRVGDDAVPIAGLVEGLLLPTESGSRTRAEGSIGLVPLRNRRFAELLGKKWETHFYLNAPQPEEVEIYVEHEKFKERIAQLQGSSGPNEPEDNNQKSAISA